MKLMMPVVIYIQLMNQDLHVNDSMIACYLEIN